MAEASKKGMKTFWDEVEVLKNEYVESELRLTNQEEDILRKAEQGDLPAIQFLVQRDPNAIYLPFIQEKIIDILLDYKWDRPGPNGKINKYRLIEIKKEIWPHFLADRSGGKLHLPEDWLISVMANKMRWGKNKIEAAQEVADLFSISFNRLYRMGNIGKRGQPKKVKNRN